MEEQPPSGQVPSSDANSTPVPPPVPGSSSENIPPQPLPPSAAVPPPNPPPPSPPPPSSMGSMPPPQPPPPPPESSTPPPYGAQPPPYGATQEPPPPPPPPPAGNPIFVGIATVPVIPSNKDERLWATLIHLGGIIGVLIAGTTSMVGFPLPFNLLVPFVIWLLKREGSPFINDQGKEALNFNITITIVGFVLLITCIGAVLLPFLGIYALIVSVIASVKANEGVAYRYPATLRFIN